MTGMPLVTCDFMLIGGIDHCVAARKRDDKLTMSHGKASGERERERER